MLWRCLILDRGCFSEGVVVKCSAIYAKAWSTEQPDRCSLLCPSVEDTGAFRFLDSDADKDM